MRVAKLLKRLHPELQEVRLPILFWGKFDFWDVLCEDLGVNSAGTPGKYVEDFEIYNNLHCQVFPVVGNNFSLEVGASMVFDEAMGREYIWNEVLVLHVEILKNGTRLSIYHDWDLSYLESKFGEIFLHNSIIDSNIKMVFPDNDWGRHEFLPNGDLVRILDNGKALYTRAPSVENIINSTRFRHAGVARYCLHKLMDFYNIIHRSGVYLCKVRPNNNSKDSFYVLRDEGSIEYWKKNRGAIPIEAWKWIGANSPDQRTSVRVIDLT